MRTHDAKAPVINLPLKNQNARRGGPPASALVLIYCISLAVFGARSEAAPENHRADQIRSNLLASLNDYGLSTPIRIPPSNEKEQRILLGIMVEGVASRISDSPCAVRWFSNKDSSDSMHLLVLNESLRLQLADTLPPLFANTNAFRILTARLIDGDMVDPVWAFIHEADLESGTQSSITILSAEDMHSTRIDPSQVWKQVLRAVSELPGVDIKTKSGSNSIFFATTDWRQLKQKKQKKPSFLVIHEMFHIKMVVHNFESCDIYVEGNYQTRKEHSILAHFFTGDVSFLELERSEPWIDPSEPYASKAVLRAIEQKLTTPHVIGHSH